MKVFLAVAITLVLTQSGVLADRVDDVVHQAMEKSRIPGLVLAVVRDGEVTKSAAYGVANLELNSPVTMQSVFEIGSLTKQFTAACVLLLAEEGKLAIDDPISKHLPTAPAGWSNITVRHLLNHSSGIKNYTGLDGFDLARRLTQRQFIERLADLPLEFAPGEQAKYCNSGYNLLGFIIENVTGRTYWSFLAERVFGPLGMASATNRDPAILVRHRADGYTWKNGAFMNRDFDLTDVFAAGAIVANIGDLVKWNAALDRGTILSASSRGQMWTPGRLSGGTNSVYGFGWRIGEYRGRKNIGHSGSTSGYSASLQRFPDDKLAVIVLCNSGEVNIATTIARQIADLHLSPSN